MLVLFLFAFQNGFFVAGHPRTTTCGKIPASLGGSPMDEAALHVENLREALRQTQRHIVTAIGASASLVFLERGIASVSGGRDDDSSTWCWRSFIRDRDLSLGDLIVLGIGDQFETLALRIKDPKLREATLEYPASIISPDPWVRFSVRRFRR